MKKRKFSASDGENEGKDLAIRMVTKVTAACYAALLLISRSWRAIFASAGPCRHSGQLPFLLLPPSYTIPHPTVICNPEFPLPHYPLGPVVHFPLLDHDNTDYPIIPLGSLSDPALYSLPSLSGTASHACIGSSHGWLVLLEPTSHVSLLNPLTTDTVALPPPLSSVRHLIPNLDDNIDLDLLPPGGFHRPLHLAEFIRFAVLSADPSDDRSSFLLLIVLEDGNFTSFLTCGPDDGYAAWSYRDGSEFPAEYLSDLAFLNGLCFATFTRWSHEHDELHPQNFIVAFDFSTNRAFSRLLHIGGDGDDDDGGLENYVNFLVESAGELLLVNMRGGPAGAHVVIYNLPSIEGDGPIVPIPKASLGDQALFLGSGNSISVAAQDFPLFVKGNTIHFPGVYNRRVDIWTVNVGCVYVHDVEQGVTWKEFEVVEQRNKDLWCFLRPWWVTPNLHRRNPQAPRGQLTDGRRN